MPETLNELLAQAEPITQAQLTPELIQVITQELGELSETEREAMLRDLLTKAQRDARDDIESLRISIEAAGTPPEVREFSDGELRDAAEYTLTQERDGDITIPAGKDREVYLFQYFFNQTDISADIGLDGVAGPETERTIVNNIRATQIFLRELGAEGVSVNGTLDSATIAAIREQFGISIENVETEEDEVERIEIAENIRMDLAREVIGADLNEENIRSYQENHNIEVSGEVSTETYFEILAGTLLGVFEEDDINRETQEKIIQVLNRGNPRGRNYIDILSRVGTFRETNEENTEYRIFIRELDAFFNNPEVNPYTAKIEEEATRPNSSGGSVLGDIPRLIEGEITMDEYIERNQGTGIIVGIIAFIFFGNRIPGFENIPGMGSWFGRIAWLVGGAMLGGGDLLRYGLGQLRDGVRGAGEYIRSPEAREMFERGRDGFSTFLTETIPDVFGEGREEILEGYTNFVSSFETQNETRRNTPEYIENIVEKGSTITGDPAFLNASRESIQRASESGDISGIISSEGLTRLNELDMSESEVQNYLRLYILPRFNDTHAVFRDTFIPGRLLERGRETVLDLTGTFIENPRLNTVIQTDIANLRNIGSDAQQRAATQLALAVQGGNLSSFEISNYPDLSTDEISRFESLIAKLQVIFETEAYIASNIERIREIEIISGATPDTTETISEKIRQLELLYSEFQIDDSRFSGMGLSTDMFSIETYEATYSSKKIELFQHAETLGILEVTLATGETINIVEILGESRRETQRETQVENLDSILESIPEVPGEDATPIEIRSYYESHRGSFDALQQTVAEHSSAIEGSHEFILKTRAEEGLEKLEALKARYSAVRTTYVSHISTLEGRVNDISSTDITSEAYRSAVLELQAISGEFHTISREINEGMSILDSIAAFRAYINDTPVFPDESNSIRFLDPILGDTENPPEAVDLVSVPVLVQSKIIEIETAYSVEVERVDNIISQPTELRAYVDALNERKSIVDTFESDSIQEAKYRQIAGQLELLQGLYLDAINREDDIVIAGQILSSYQTFVQPSISEGFWGDIWTTIQDIFSEQDIVEAAYQAKVELNDSLQVYNILAGSAQAREFLETAGYYDYDEDEILSDRTKSILHSFDGSTTTLRQVLEALETVSQSPYIYGRHDADGAREVYDALNQAIEVYIANL